MEAAADQSEIFDPGALSREEQYKLLVGSVVPRPIALVSTLGPRGPNAAPLHAPSISPIISALRN